MQRKSFLLILGASALLTLTPGCSDQSLSSLKVGPSDQVVTYDVIGGM